MTQALSGGALLLALNLLLGNIGNLGVPLRAWVALGVWLAALLPSMWPGVAASKTQAKALAAVLLAAAPLAFRFGGVHAIFGIFLSLLALPALNHETKTAEPNRQLMLIVTAVVGVGALLTQVFPITFAFTEQLSSWTCTLSSFLRGQAIQLGPSYSGIWIGLIFVIFHFCAFALSTPKRPRWLAMALAGQFVSLLAYQLVFHALLARWRLDSPWVVLGAAQAALFLVGFALVVLQLRQAAPRVVQVQFAARGSAMLAMATVVLMLSVEDTFWAAFRPHARPKVLLYDDGWLDWSVPVYGKYGGMAGGMFGSLGPYLQRHQCDVIRGSLTNLSLENANVLVVFNLMRKFTPAEKSKIWEFVSAGGGLLAVGDHTGTTQIREPFNDLLEPVNIRFNFDSAMPLRTKWVKGFECPQHYITAALDSETDAQINVGASLSVGWPGRPLILGRHGYSDKGDPQNRAMGYLGNRWYSNDERLGDVVLAASAGFHQGKVLVFGDTSSFQNGALARSGDFVLAVMQWFALPGRAPGRFLLQAIAAAAVLWLWLGLGFKRSWHLAWGTLFVSLYLGYVARVIVDRACARPGPSAAAMAEALIDDSHLNRCDNDLWQPEGLGGVVQNLMRKNYLPVVSSRFSPGAIGNSKLVFLVAPAKKFRASEVDAYESFVRGGGSLFICVGYEDAGGCNGLLSRFGLRVRNLPLGALGADVNDAGVSFLNAWPIVCEGEAGEVLCQYQDYPLIVRKTLGAGSVFLIGDSGFFQNRNLEAAESYNLKNIQFFEKLVPGHE